MDERQGDAKRSAAMTSLVARLRGVLVRCAVCERDQALVRSHAAADRVLATHLDTCPGPITAPHR